MFGIAAAAAGTASAQAITTGPGTAGDLSIAAFDPGSAVSPISVVQGPGWRIGEGTVLHPVFGMETGYLSNVFYTNQNPQAVGILRLTGQLGIASEGGARMDPTAGGTGLADLDQPDFQYQLSARLAYDQMIGGDSAANDSGGLGLGVLARGMVNPMGPLSFGFQDDFTRTIRASNFETLTSANRDINTVGALLYHHRQGSSLSGYIYGRNTIDIFEDVSNNYPDRMDTRFGVHPMWRWLPQTLVWGDASFGVISGLGDGAASKAKATSFPLSAMVGLSTLFSLKTMAWFDVGYTNGFYSSGPSYQAPRFDANLAYLYSPLGRIGVSYSYMFQDSVNANYFRDHLLRAYFVHGLEPFVLVVAPELHFREYVGLPLPMATSATRDDIVFATVAGIHYTFRNWIAATVDYRFETVQTNFRYMDASGETIDPSYVRHELLAGVRIAM